MAIPQFADISAFQVENIDWKRYRAWAASFDGVARISMKSTEGVGFTDAHFHEYRNGALAAGVDRCIYYHFARPDLGNTPEAEADYQHSVVGNVRDGDILMLDYEVTKPQATADWAYRWLARQEANYGGKLPTPYASSAYILEHLQDARLSRYPLTLANWTYNPSARPACPSPWKSYAYLQFTDQDRVIPGIPGKVDANIFLGEEDSMAIDINSPNVATFFEETDANHWKCKSNSNVVQYGMLTDYKATNGLLSAGLPITNEIPIIQFGAQYATLKDSGIVVQFYERLAKIYDPSFKIDHPPGAGAVYNLHLYNSGPGTDPLVNQLKNEIANLQKQLQSFDPTDATKLAQIKAIVG